MYALADEQTIIPSTKRHARCLVHHLTRAHIISSQLSTASPCCSQIFLGYV